MAQETEKEILDLKEVTIRFAGDSGDGMQLTGSQFSDTTALMGNDLGTLPDYPAEITQKDLDAKKDPQMDKAVELLLSN